MARRIQNSIGNVTTDIIEVSLEDLGRSISDLIRDVGQLNVVSVGDLNVFGSADGAPPADVAEAMKWGTKVFDAMFYFALEDARRPRVAGGVDGTATFGADVIIAKKRLLWMSIFLMLRGSYPSSAGNAVGTDVPAFLRNICGMNESPAATADGLASFDLMNVGAGWIRFIDWSTMAAPIRQRLSLGLAGYRALGPFKIFPCRADATAEARAAYDWVIRAVNIRPDYAILSCTRSPVLVARLGSWNNALGNLMIECFTPVQIAQMVATKIIFQAPVRDPRHDTWRTWVIGGDLALADPIGL